VQQYGISGLIIATFIAGVVLVIMGLTRLGNVIKFIPYPLIVGFTSGIAVIIFSSQVKDFLGLKMGAVPADFIGKWMAFGQHLGSVNLYAVAISVFTVLTVALWPKITHKIPGSLIAILLTTLAVAVFHLPVQTIGSRFGSIASSLPSPIVPKVTLQVLQQMIRPAFTIAMLGSIESLLSAVVSDGMTGGNHRSNTELIAQGIANIGSSIFGGIPATGAIARTATNIRNGGRTPVAGMVHALTLLVIMLFVGKWAVLIPMPTLAGILVIIAWNMSEIDSFRFVLKGSKSDATVLLATFLLTVFIDLTVAIEIGMILAAFLFMRRMMQTSSVLQTGVTDDRADDITMPALPEGVDVFEINGPLFFGAAYKFRDTMKMIENPAKVLIIRMDNVPVIDATGLRILKDVYHEVSKKGSKLILSEISSEQVTSELQKARLLFLIGKANVTATFENALERAGEVLKK
ncbi:MAG: STAS domain-containing protein, partial [Bacteroidetes bacterium]|nr:STAS domain-containing protein [Bacteroidota bacterium]